MDDLENKIKQVEDLPNKQIKVKAEEFLSDLRESHSKTTNLQSYTFQNYLSSSSQNLSTNDKKLLFQLRTRSTHTKANYKNKYKFDMSWTICKDKNSVQTDSQLLICSGIDNTLVFKTDLRKVEHSNIFEDLHKQTQVAQVYKEIFKLLQ